PAPSERIRRVPRLTWFWRSRALCLCFVFTILAGGPVWAQDAVEQPVEAQRTPVEPPAMDLGDLWRLVRHKDAPSADASKRFLVAAPSIGSKPSTGLNGGLSGNVAF